MRRASQLALAVAGVLVFTKASVWLASGSLSMLSTLVDSLLDVGISLVNFFAVRAALTPADHEHRFGHGKAEALAALGQAVFIVASSCFLVYAAIGRFSEPVPIQNELLGILAMLAAIIATFLLVTFQRFVIRQTGSLAISADRMHYETDILVNLGVMLALIIEWQFGKYWVDPLFAIIIAFYMLFSSRKILITALDVLLDREINEADRNVIVGIIRAEPQAHDFHDLRTRAAGPHYFIQFHLELDKDMSLEAAHDVTDRIEQAIIKAFPQAHVSIHQEPAGIQDERDNF